MNNRGADTGCIICYISLGFEIWEHNYDGYLFIRMLQTNDVDYKSYYGETDIIVTVRLDDSSERQAKPLGS